MFILKSSHPISAVIAQSVWPATFPFLSHIDYACEDSMSIIFQHVYYSVFLLTESIGEDNAQQVNISG